MATTKAERRRTVMNTQNFDPSLIADPPSGPAAAPAPAPPAMSTNAPASKAAPPRSSAPRQSAQSVSSTASNSSSRQPSQKTLDQVLAAANPPGDVNAALAALLEERNSVAQQNAQLWRIIEKQKSSLATATKDLERIRAERERYRRLFEETTAASGSGSELERRHARSRSSSKMPQGARAVSQSRAPMSRHQSDDVVPRAPSHDGPSHLNGHSGGSDSRLDEIVQQPLLADRDATLQSSRLPARSESLPVASNISAASSKTSLAASSVAGDTATPPSQPISALEPPNDPNALSVRASKRGARESRITSAEEVQKYISGMEQSLPPAPDGSAMPGSTSASRQLPVPPPQASVLPAVAAVSPMNFDSTFAQRMTPPTQPVPVQQTPPNRSSDQDYSKTPTQTNIGFVAPPPPPPLPNAHARAAPEPYNDTDDDFSADGHSSTVYSPADSNSRQGIPMIIRNAPSMTSMNVHANLQSNQAASLHSSVPDDSTLFESSPIATSPTTSTTSTPPPYLQPTYQPPSQAQPPKMARTESQQTTTTINPPKLTPFDMSTAIITVPLSHIRANDRGKEVLSFVIEIALDPMSEREGWKIEKLYSDVLALDGRVRQVLSRSALKKIAPLPDAKLFRDNAPAKVDQRKVMLQTYLSTVLAAPWKNPADVTGFFTSDVILHARAPVSHPGYKEGYLTKRGKNFGGWKTRYFVLQSPVLEYYESRGGAHLGSISLAGSQIGRQQRQASRDAEDENAYRHAFLIIEGKRGPSGALNRHVLCAESDEERDSWVEVLVRYVVGEYDKHGDPSQTQSQSTQAPSRASTSSFQDPPRRTRAMSKDEILKGNALPISQLAPDASNAKLFQAPPPPPELAPSGGPQGSAPIPIDGAVKQIMDPAQDVHLSSSLPSHLDVAMGGDGAAGAGGQPGQRSNSELGHYPDMPPPRKPNRASYHPSAAQAPRPPSPDKVKISGPINGVPIPAGKYGGKDWDVSNPGPSANNDRERKAKSGRFWGFGKAPSDKPPVAVPAAPVGRAVFGIPLQESLAIAQIANLPAIVFRCIEYLEAKRADQEEGIYRLSGSSAVIKSLKDKFNAEGDVHLLESEEYWDPHAVAGLLKSFLRELPSSILTRELHLSFLAVIDLADPQERVSELASLIAQLPIANYSLLRALTAHLILIVQNSNVNKMTMRNVGIVFSPTLGIPAGVFSLMLNEFNRVFSVEAESSTEAAPVSASTPVEEKLVVPLATDTSSASARGKRGMSDPSRRNSRSYNEAHADKLLGLGGRTLKVDEESDEDDDAIEDNDNDSEAETDHSGLVAGSPSEVAPAGSLHQRLEPPTNDSAHRGHSAAVAASRGLQIAPPGPGGHRRTASGMGPGLPQSPRPAGRLPGSPAHSTGSPATPRT